MLELPKYLKGQLLLDSGQLNGSFFQRTVVLICQHDEEGAFGLVLNRTSGNKLGEMLVADVPDSTQGTTAVSRCGPVQLSALSYLHSDNFLPEASVMPNLDLGHSLDSLVELGESFSATKKVKMFAGYAGWSPGQLEDEMKRESVADPSGDAGPRFRHLAGETLANDFTPEGNKISPPRRHAGGQFIELMRNGRGRTLKLSSHSARRQSIRSSRQSHWRPSTLISSSNFSGGFMQALKRQPTTSSNCSRVMPRERHSS